MPRYGKGVTEVGNRTFDPDVRDLSDVPVALPLPVNKLLKVSLDFSSCAWTMGCCSLSIRQVASSKNLIARNPVAVCPWYNLWHTGQIFRIWLRYIRFKSCRLTCIRPSPKAISEDTILLALVCELDSPLYKNISSVCIVRGIYHKMVVDQNIQTMLDNR